MSGRSGPPSRAELMRQMMLKGYANTAINTSGIKKVCPIDDELKREVNELKKRLEREMDDEQWDEFPPFDDGYHYETKDGYIYVDTDERDAMAKMDQITREDELLARKERRDALKEVYDQVKMMWDDEQAKNRKVEEPPKEQKKPQRARMERAPVNAELLVPKSSSSSSSDDEERYGYDESENDFDDEESDGGRRPRSRASNHSTSYIEVAERGDGKLNLDVLKELQVKQTELLEWYDSTFEKNVLNVFIKAKIDGKPCIARIDGIEDCDPYTHGDNEYIHLLEVTRIKDRHHTTIKVTDVLNEPFSAQDLNTVTYNDYLPPRDIKRLQTAIRTVRDRENSPERQREKKVKFALSPKCTSGQFIVEILREERSMVEKLKAELSHDPDDVDLKSELEKHERIVQQIIQKKDTLAPMISRSEIAPTKKVDPQQEKLEQSLLRMQRNRKEIDEGPKTKLESTSAMSSSIDLKGLMGSSSDDDDGSDF